MASATVTYGASTMLTCSFGGIDTGAARISDYVDNSGTNALDAMVQVNVGLTTGGATGNDNAVYIYFYGSEDDTYFDDNVTGTDAAIILRDPNNLKGPYALAFPSGTNGPANVATIGSVASYFGGVLPRKWGIVVENQTNCLLVATATNAAFCTASYTLIKEEVA